MNRRRVCSVALLLLSLSALRAQTNHFVVFDSANKLYEQGKYAEAVSAYESLAQSGNVSAALYYNLGNAFFKSGQLGRAVAAYRQAERIAPRDPDLRANLQFARSQVQGPTFSPSAWQRWLVRLTLNEWTWLASGALWLWFFILALIQVRPGLKSALRRHVLWLGLAAGLLCACLGATFHDARSNQTVIATKRDTPVRQGPLDEAANAFTVHDGAELRVLDHKDDWFQIAAGPGRIGWLRRDQIVFVPQG
jgi:tetratricopeptide (TPR) repeat protein